MDVFVGRTGGSLCLVMAVGSYISFRGPESGPFLQLPSGQPLHSLRVFKLLCPRQVSRPRSTQATASVLGPQLGLVLKTPSSKHPATGSVGKSQLWQSDDCRQSAGPAEEKGRKQPIAGG